MHFLYGLAGDGKIQNTLCEPQLVKDPRIFLGQIIISSLNTILVSQVIVLQVQNLQTFLIHLKRINILGAVLFIFVIKLFMTYIDSDNSNDWRLLATIKVLSADPILFFLYILVKLKLAVEYSTPRHIMSSSVECRRGTAHPWRCEHDSRRFLLRHQH